MVTFYIQSDKEVLKEQDSLRYSRPPAKRKPSGKDRTKIKAARKQKRKTK